MALLLRALLRRRVGVSDTAHRLWFLQETGPVVFTTMYLIVDEHPVSIKDVVTTDLEELLAAERLRVAIEAQPLGLRP